MKSKINKLPALFLVVMSTLESQAQAITICSAQCVYDFQWPAVAVVTAIGNDLNSAITQLQGKCNASGWRLVNYVEYHAQQNNGASTPCVGEANGSVCIHVKVSAFNEKIGCSTSS